MATRGQFDARQARGRAPRLVSVLLGLTTVTSVALAITALQVHRARQREAVRLAQLLEIIKSRAQDRLDRAAAYRALGNQHKKARQLNEAVECYQTALQVLEDVAAAFPEEPEYAHSAAITRAQMGLALQDLKRWREAEELHRVALATLEVLVARHPRSTEYRRAYAVALNNLGVMACERGDFAAALRFADRAMPEERLLRASDPQKYRDVRQLTLRLHAAVLSRLGRHREAAAAADELADVFTESWNEAYIAAWAVARGVDFVEQDAALTPEQRRDLAQAYADRAIKLIEQAVARGFSNRKYLERDELFHRLRSRPDFQRLLATIKKPASRPSLPDEPTLRGA